MAGWGVCVCVCVCVCVRERERERERMQKDSYLKNIREIRKVSCFELFFTTTLT